MAHLARIRADGGQRRSIVFGGGDVVETHHGDVAARRDSPRRQRARRSHGDDIVVTDEGGRWPGPGQRAFDRDAAAVSRRRRLEDQGFVGGYPPAVERGAPTADALLLRGHAAVAADEADATMTQPQQVLDRVALPSMVVW